MPARLHRNNRFIPKFCGYMSGIAAACIAAPFVLPAYTTGTDTLSPPNLSHWLGTNDLGQDVLLGLLYATPNTILIALTAATLTMALCILWAALIGTQNGIFRKLGLRLVDILQILPSILVMLLIAAWTQPDFIGVILLLVAISWIDDVRVLATVLRRETTRESVEFARRMGASWPYCLKRHIFPAIWPTIFALFIQQVRKSTLKTAGLGFLGLCDPRLLTWGSMMQDGQDHLYDLAWSWLFLPPSALTALFLLLCLACGPDRIFQKENGVANDLH